MPFRDRFTYISPGWFYGRNFKFLSTLVLVSELGGVGGGGGKFGRCKHIIGKLFSPLLKGLIDFTGV